MQTLEHEFHLYKIALVLLEMYQGFIDPVSLITIFGEEKNEDPKIKAALEKALRFAPIMVRDIGDNIVPFRDPREKTYKAFVRCIKFTMDNLGKEIHEIPSHLVKPLCESFGYGNEDDNIQSKFETLLIRIMSGEEVRKKYFNYVDNLDPPDAKILDVMFEYKKKCILNKEPDKRITLMALKKDVQLKYPKMNISLFDDSLDELLTSGILVRGGTEREGSKISGQYPESAIGLSKSGLTLMKILDRTSLIQTNQPSDTSSQTSAN